MKFKRTGYLWVLLALMLNSGMSLAQQMPDLQSMLEIRISQPAPSSQKRSQSIPTPNGPGGISSERLNLRDANIVSVDLEKLLRKKELEDGRQILCQLALCVAGLKVPRNR